MSSINSLMTKILQPLRKRLIKETDAENVCGKFLEYFEEFNEVQAVKKIFGEKTIEILTSIKVEFNTSTNYMYVDGKYGHIVISKNYIQKGNKIDIYLDLIHELFHVKQFLDGEELFDKNYKYVDRPTEIEAYKYTVQEAKNIGLTEKRICQYLKTEWIDNSDLNRLAKAVNINNYTNDSKASQ